MILLVLEINAKNGVYRLQGFIVKNIEGASTEANDLIL